MSIPHEDLTAEIGALLNGEGRIDARTNTNVAENLGDSLDVKVSAEMCRRWRRRVRHLDHRRDHIAEGADIDITACAVGDHVAGDCGHEVDEPPVERVREMGQ